MESHSVVAFEFLLADRTRKPFVWVCVLVHVSVESVTLEAGEVAVFRGTFERFLSSVFLRHVTYLGRSMNEHSATFLARPHVIGVKESCVLVEANVIFKGFVANSTCWPVSREA